jgi:hypothetical protein
MSPEGTTTTPEPDIPDVNAGKAPTIVLPGPVTLERQVRRYIKKDGVFRKDFYLATLHPTDVKAAEAEVAEALQKSGRTVTTGADGRLRAEPGWNLEIRVPGMEVQEQKAPAPLPDAKEIEALKAENAAMKKAIEAINTRLDGAKKKSGDKR